MTDVELANLALRRVGEQTIMSLNETSKNAKTINLIFDPVLEQVLAKHNWNCAKKRAALAQLTEVPAYGWGYQYQLPVSPKCLRVIRIEDYEDDFAIEGDKLLCDNSTCNILYIAKIESHELSPLVAKVFYLSMAVEMAYSMTENNTILNGIYEQLNQALAEARQIDSHEGSVELIEDNPWINSRFAGLGYNVNNSNVR